MNQSLMKLWCSFCFAATQLVVNFTVVERGLYLYCRSTSVLPSARSSNPTTFTRYFSDSPHFWVFAKSKNLS